VKSENRGPQKIVTEIVTVAKIPRVSTLEEKQGVIKKGLDAIDLEVLWLIAWNMKR
jgi:hypothetical protein